MKDKIKALIVEPNKEPYTIEHKYIEDKLYGLIYYPFEKLEIEKDIFLIFSKQAKSNEKMFPKNRQVEGHQIYGTFAVVKIQNKEYVSLTEKELVELKQYFK